MYKEEIIVLAIEGAVNLVAIIFIFGLIRRNMVDKTERSIVKGTLQSLETLSEQILETNNKYVSAVETAYINKTLSDSLENKLKQLEEEINVNKHLLLTRLVKLLVVAVHGRANSIRYNALGELKTMLNVGNDIIVDEDFKIVQLEFASDNQTLILTIERLNGEHRMYRISR